MSIGDWAQVFSGFFDANHSVNKGFICFPFQSSSHFKVKEEKENLNPRRIKWTTTNSNHRGCGRSQGRESVGRLLCLSISQISVGPPWGHKKSSSCLGKGSSQHPLWYVNGSLFNVSTNYLHIYCSTLVCVVHILYCVLEAWFVVLFYWDWGGKKNTVHHAQDIYPCDVSCGMPSIMSLKTNLFTRHFLKIVTKRDWYLFSTYFSSLMVSKKKIRIYGVSIERIVWVLSFCTKARYVIIIPTGDGQWNFSPHLMFISLGSYPALFVLLHHLCLFKRVTLLICCLHCSFHWGLLNSSLLHISCRYVARASSCWQ